MDLPNPLGAAAAFATFVRARLAEVSDTFNPFTPRWAHSDEMHEAARAAHAVAMVIVGAAAPFAPTSYARARLLRQLHASGLLTAGESERAVSLLEIAQ
jgi:hypothetical protein